MKRLFVFLAAAAVFSNVALGAAETPATFKVSEFTFQRPVKWAWVETTSSMRKAQLSVPNDGAKKDPAEVIFFHFGPSNGGGVQANVERWFGQFEGPREKIGAKSEAVKIGKHNVTLVRAEGTYRSGMPGGAPTPKPGYALRGAIIESEAGDVFVKMTGPESLVKSADAEFRKMIESALK